MPVRLVGQRPGDRRGVGHGRDGRARAPAAGPGRRAVPDLGSQRRARRSASACRSRRTGCSRSCSGPTSGPVPCLVKPLSRRALRRPNWPVAVNRLVSYVTLPWVRLVARDAAARRAKCRSIRHFDERFTRLWERARATSSRSRCGAMRAYLNWKYIQPPHVRYSVAALDARRRGRRLRGLPPRAGAARPRHAARRLPADPDDARGLLTLLRWIDREARAADSDKIRTFAMHEGFRRLLQKSGYYSVKSTMEFVAKVNAVDVPPAFYKDTEPLARHARRFGSGSMTRPRRPALLVAIDTEGDNQWDARRAPPPDVRQHLRARAPARVLRRATASGRPTSSPIRSRRDPRSAEVLRALLARGDCEIGAHHHAWETPPFEPADVDRHPYALSLPLDAVRRATGVADARDHRRRRRRGRCRIARAASASRRRTCRRSNARATWWTRASRRCSTKRTSRARTSSARRSRRTSSPTTTRRGRARATCSSCRSPRRSIGACPAWLERWYARAPWPYTTKRVLRLARHRARPLAAAVLQLGRRHDRARAPDSPGAARRSSTCCFTRARPSSAAVRTTDAGASSTRSSIGSAAR